MKQKNMFLIAITLVIAGLVITGSASGFVKPEKTSEKRIETIVAQKNFMPNDIAKSKDLEKTIMHSEKGMLADPLFSQAQDPAIGSSANSMSVAFYSELQENVYIGGSGNAGGDWTDAVAWTWDEPPSDPDVDGCGDGRLLATMVPNYFFEDGSAMVKVEVSNAADVDEGYAATYWTWNDVGDGYYNFIDLACAGYTAVDGLENENEWAYGGISIVGDHGTLGEQTCFFSYQATEDGTAWIYTLTDEPGSLNGATSTSIDIDPVTLYSYAVYNYENGGENDLYIFIMDFGQWGEQQGYNIHENTWESFLSTPGDDENLDISAYQDNVIIVSERDGNIMGYYVNDLVGDNEFTEVTIAADAELPRITHLEENKAVVEYIKDGVLYYVITEDGGATWGSPNQVSEEDEVLSADVCKLGSAFEYQNTVYYQPGDFGAPIIEVGDIQGGIGISVPVNNIGTVDVQDLPYSISVTGGILGRINVQDSGTISVTAGDSATISTDMIIGLGAIDISVTVGSVTKTATGSQLLIFSRI